MDSTSFLHMRWPSLVCSALFLVIWVVNSSLFADDFRVPPLRGPVNDEARMVSSKFEGALGSALKKLYEGRGTQISVLTVENLGGLSIEDASIRVVDEWKLGGQKSDRGVLLMLAKSERTIRIEVGQGLEGDLTDAHSKRIIDEAMVPLLRSGHVEAALLVGVSQIVSRTDPDFDFKSMVEQGGFSYQPRGKKGISIFEILLFLFIFLVVVGSRGGLLGFLLGVGLGRHSRGGLGRYSGGLGGGLGGGFGGGGGWSGGGGGFSGGGASGRW